MNLTRRQLRKLILREFKFTGQDFEINCSGHTSI